VVSLPAVGATLTVTANTAANANDGLCSLREALNNVMIGSNLWADCPAAGAYGNNDTINFNIGAGSVQAILPTTPFPDITKPVVIDGFSNPGAQAGTNLATYPALTAINALITIEIDFQLFPAGQPFSGFVVKPGGNGTIIRGLSLGNFAGGAASGALIELQAPALVRGNFIGVRADGLTPWANQSYYGVKVM
jgi:hypothetical protein